MIKANGVKKFKVAPTTKLKVGDTVRVIRGDDKGKSGKVLQVVRSKGQVVVEGVNIIKKHIKPNQFTGQAGQIIEKNAPILASKVAIEIGGKISKIGTNRVEGKKIRIAKATGKEI